MPTCSREPPEEPQLKHPKLSPELNGALEKRDVDNLKENFTKNEPFASEKLQLITEPFKFCVIDDLIHESAILDKVRDEFNEIPWNRRNMDLYELFQSEDLKHLNDFKNVRMVYEFLQTEVLRLVSNLTGFELTRISATCSFYSYTDYLLVHDDQQDDRMVAFVLYLTGKEGWREDWGGALQLFSRDENDQPDRSIKDVYPVNNRLVFFPVNAHTYHQVNFCSKFLKQF